MTDYEDAEVTNEPAEREEDELLEAQTGKGYGEDEGEREDTLADE